MSIPRRFSASERVQYVSNSALIEINAWPVASGSPQEVDPCPLQLGDEHLEAGAQFVQTLGIDGVGGRVVGEIRGRGRA